MEYIDPHHINNIHITICSAFRLWQAFGVSEQTVIRVGLQQCDMVDCAATLQNNAPRKIVAANDATKNCDVIVRTISDCFSRVNLYITPHTPYIHPCNPRLVVRAPKQ